MKNMYKVSMILWIIALVCFFALGITYIITGEFVLAALYMCCASIDGINAYVAFKNWIWYKSIWDAAKRRNNEE